MTHLSLLPSQNTYISSGKPDANFSKSNVLYAGVDSQGSVQRALLSFDLCLLPSDIVIDAAVLRMYADNISERTIPAFITPYILTSSWDEKDVNWSNQPVKNTSLAGKTVEVLSYGWYNWDITNIMQVWILNSGSNSGLILESMEDGTRDIKKFHSARSYYYRNYRPYLEIRYSYKNSFSLSSRNTVNVFETYNTLDLLSFSAWQNTSIYSMYTFFIQNTGQNAAQVFIQISPDRTAVYDEAGCSNIPPGSVEAIVPQRFGFFSRVAFKSSFFARSTTLKIWFQAQV